MAARGAEIRVRGRGFGTVARQGPRPALHRAACTDQRRARRPAPRSAFPALLAVLLAAVAGCAPLAATASPTPPGGAVVPLAPTPWPSGTLGPYGLRIDPRLLQTFPAVVSGERLVEAADLEVQALDNADLPVSFDALAAARIGGMEDPNWVVVTIAHARPAALSDDFYARWRDDYAAGACSHADGVGSSTQETIGDRSVDVASCRGGVDAYSLRLENDLLVSLSDLGPRRLGRQLIAAIS